MNLINLMNPFLESAMYLGRRGAFSLDPEFALSLSMILEDDLSLIKEEFDLDCDIDPQLDIDELGYEAIPLWGQDTPHDFPDQVRKTCV